MDENLIKRLESAVAPLEALSWGGGAVEVGGDDAVEMDPSIIAFGDLISEYVGKVTGGGEKIGGKVLDVSKIAEEAFSVQKELLIKIKRTQILVEYRNKDANHVEWAKALKELYVPGLRDYVKSHYPLGPVWSAAGKTTASVPPKVFKTGGPAPPPPPPATLLSSETPQPSSSHPKVGMAAVFQEINSGKSETSGLRKVTDDMKSKNRVDKTGIVSAGAKEGRFSSPSFSKIGPPKLELQMGRNSCKVNNITVDKCTKMGVVFTDVVAACEIVNCSGVEVQCQGSAPTISVDNTAGCQLYLSKDSLEASITTAKSSEVNVLVPGSGADSDWAEHSLPQQYVHVFKDGHFVTTPVSHSGG